MLKSRAMDKIERRMQAIEPGSLRYQVLESAKNFKSSWITLGQMLYTVNKDKLYKEWGYLTFEAYCKSEIGIQKNTASKLLHSYYFLEKDEPQFLKSIHAKSDLDPKIIPGVDAVNALRLVAKNRELSEGDYEDFKRGVFDEGREAKDIKREIGLRLRSLREEEDPRKTREERRGKTVRRLIATVRSLQKEVVIGKFVSERTARELEMLLEHLQAEVG